jgi:hypothetical protein
VSAWARKRARRRVHGSSAVNLTLGGCFRHAEANVLHARANARAKAQGAARWAHFVPATIASLLKHVEKPR